MEGKCEGLSARHLYHLGSRLGTPLVRLDGLGNPPIRVTFPFGTDAILLAFFILAAILPPDALEHDLCSKRYPLLLGP